MSLTLLIALLTSVPLAILCWLFAASIDQLGAAVRLRVVAWTIAMALPVALVPAALIVHTQGVKSSLSVIDGQPDVGQQAKAHRPAQVQRSLPPVDMPLPWVEFTLAFFALGAAVRLGAYAISALRIAKLVSEASPIEGTVFRGRTPVLHADCSTPVLAGIRRPVILLPRHLLNTLTNEQVELICAHEEAHLKAGDHIAHLVEELAVRLFWFNFPMQAIRTGLLAAREEACDARVLASCDTHTRRVYAQSLFSAFRHAADNVPVAAFTGGSSSVRRMRAIVQPQEHSAAFGNLTVLAAGSCLTLVTGGLTLALASQPLEQTDAVARLVAPSSAAFTARHMVEHDASDSDAVQQRLIAPRFSLSTSSGALSAPHAGKSMPAVRAEQPERLEQLERAEQPERPEQAERPEQPERPERAELPERPERT